jgi:hypothetical protein
MKKLILAVAVIATSSLMAYDKFRQLSDQDKKEVLDGFTEGSLNKLRCLKSPKIKTIEGVQTCTQRYNSSGKFDPSEYAGSLVTTGSPKTQSFIQSEEIFTNDRARGASTCIYRPSTTNFYEFEQCINTLTKD